MTAKATKKSGKKAGPKAEPLKGLVTQPKGGAIWQGAPANPVAGTGRPPDAIRARLRGSFEDRIALLEQFADGLMEAPHADRLRAIDMLAKYGFGVKDEVTLVHPDVKARLDAQVQLIASKATWATEELLTALNVVWA